MKKKIIIIVVAIAALILTIFNIRSMINIGIKKSGVTDTIPVVIRKNYLDALVALAKDESIYDYYSLLDNKDEALISKYPLLKSNDLCIYNGKDKAKLEKILAKGEAFLNVSKRNFADKNVVINDYIVSYYVFNYENNGIKDIYNSVEELSYKEQIKYAKEYVLDEYKTIGVSLNDYQIKFMLLHILYELLYVFMVLLAVYYVKKNRL